MNEIYKLGGSDGHKVPAIHSMENLGDPNDPKVKNAEDFLRYIEETGLSMSFKIIFTEILSKKVPEDKVFAYTATRLRQIGEDIAYIQNSKYRKGKKH